MADARSISISLGRFKLTISRREQHLLMIIVFTAVVGGCFFLLNRHRWDDPWLAADDRYLIVAVKFDRLSIEDNRFKTLRDAVLSTPMDGFQPNDYGTNNAPSPLGYSYLRVYCYPHAFETLEADAATFKKKLAASISKTGINADWRLAIIPNSGDRIFPK